jgi:hypothetical protein
VLSVRRPASPSQLAEERPATDRRWLAFTVIAAVLAFVGAALWAAAGNEEEADEEVRVEPAHATARVRRLPPPAADRAQPAPEPAAAEPDAPSAPPVREQRELREQREPGPASQPRRPTRAPVRRVPPKTELKNPFG